MFRHSFATHFLETDAALRSIQESLDHEQVPTAQICTDVSLARLKRHIDNL